VKSCRAVAAHPVPVSVRRESRLEPGPRTLAGARACGFLAGARSGSPLRCAVAWAHMRPRSSAG